MEGLDDYASAEWESSDDEEGDDADDDEMDIDAVYKRRANSNRLFATVVLLLNMGVIVYYFGVVWLNTLIVNGYPRQGSPPGPNEFWSNMWSVQFFFLYIMILNILPPIFLGLWAASRKDGALLGFQFSFSLVALLTNAVVAVYLFVEFLINCNRGSSGLSACNDYRWCGYPDNWDSLQCANTGPFDPPVSGLVINGEWQQHMIFTAVFFVLSVINIFVPTTMR